MEGMQFAPEIMQGIEHDVVVDVWGLGQLVLKLLALTSDYGLVISIRLLAVFAKM